MKRFSKLCIALSASVLLAGGLIALSATALLAGGLPGQAQSQVDPARVYPEGGLLNNISRLHIASYEQRDAPAGIGFEPAKVTANFGLSRVGNERSMLLSVTITAERTDGQGDPVKITFSDIPVGPDGVYQAKLAGGHHVRGKVSNFLRSNWTDKGLSGSYTGPDGSNVTFETDQGVASRGGPLSDLIYFDSWKYSVDDYIDYGRFLASETDFKLEHIKRGESLFPKEEPEKEPDSSGKETGKKETRNLSADPILYRDHDRDGAPFPIILKPKNGLSCTGMICKQTIGDASEGTLKHFRVFDPGDFLPINGSGGGYDANALHVVLPHRGIYLTLDRSRNNAIGAPLSFGAWMDHAGFFVASGGTYGGGRGRDARMVVAAGERTDSRPAANAVWRGSMVGTVLEGRLKDNLLRGDAELRFDISSATLDAHFFNIRDLNRFGAPHVFEDVQSGPKNRLHIANIPVAADGSYAKNFGHRNNIEGAFYGEGYAETAGIFEKKLSIIGAFGAKKVTAN